MSKAGNLPKNEQHYIEKIEYETILGYKKKAVQTPSPTKEQIKTPLLSGPKEHDYRGTNEETV
jgi:hypothetical protein